LQITLDRHNARPSLKYYFLSNPSHFSLPSTFKRMKIGGIQQHQTPSYCDHQLEIRLK
jgi:hypothetical protein